MKKKIIIREKFSLLSQLYLNIFKKRINSVYFCVPYQIDSFEDNNNFCKAVKKYNLSHQIEEKITFKANQLTINYIEKHIDLRTHFLANLFIKKFKSKKIFLAIQKYLIRNIQDRIRLILVFQHIKKHNSEYDVKVLFNDQHFKSINKFMNFNYNSNTLNFYKYFNFIKTLTTDLSYTIVYLPFILLKSLINNGIRVTKINTKTFDICQHIANGLNNKEIENYKKFKVSRSDNKLIENFDNKKDFLFVYSHWKFDKEEQKINNKQITDYGASYTDETKLAVSSKNIFLLLNYYWLFLKLYFTNIKNSSDKEIPMRKFLLVLKDSLEHELFCEYYRVKVFFSRDDYSPKHITRTIIQNKYQLFHSSIHHSLFIKPYTSLLFLYNFYDIYFIHGEGYLEFFKNYWFSKEYVNVGSPNAEQIIEAQNDIRTKNMFRKNFGDNINILVLLPSIGGSTPFNHYSLMENSFSNITSLLKINPKINIFLRPRSMKHYIEFKKIIKIDESDKNRVHFILNDFSTFELIAFSDILIAEDTSSGLVEAFANEKIIIVPYMVRQSYKEDLIWADYSEETVFDSIDDISIYLRDLIDNKKHFYNNKINSIKTKFFESPSNGTWQKICKELTYKIDHL